MFKPGRMVFGGTPNWMTRWPESASYSAISAFRVRRATRTDIDMPRRQSVSDSAVSSLEASDSSIGRNLTHTEFEG